MESNPSHRSPHPAPATGEAPWGLPPCRASLSPVPAGPRAPWCSQERTVEKRTRRGEGTPKAKTSLDPAPLLFPRDPWRLP